MAENDNPELTLQDAKSICARIAEVVRQRDELVEEVQALRQVLSELTAVRALLAETPGERVYARVATNGHIAPRGGDAAGEGAILLQMTDDDPDAERSDVHHGDPQEDASAISALTPPASLLPAEHDAPASPIGETGAGETAPSPTPWLAPDGPIDPVEASSTATPSLPVEAGGRPPDGTLLARILDLIEQSDRTKRPWQVRKELRLSRLPCAELSKLTAEKCLVRVRDGCYGIPGRDYGGAASAEGINS